MLHMDFINAILPDESPQGETGHHLLETLHQFAESLGEAIDAKDPCTSSHSEQVAEVSAIIAHAMDMPGHDVHLIHIAGHLHDIGKIGIPDAILKKSGLLTDKEWVHIRAHPEIGATIVRPVEAFSAPGGVADIILHHHERFDGSGYPNGLAGENIPLGARIIAVADSLSAMTQDRPYRKGRSFENAVSEITHCSGTLYDPAVVEAFLRVADRTEEKVMVG